MKIKKTKCIIFILKNNEQFLINNINTILNFKKEYDLIFVVRESNDRTIQILKTNELKTLDLSYDSGYEEALKVGFEFIDTKYETVIEFGEIDKIQLNEIYRFSEINEEFKETKDIIFAAKTGKWYRNRKLFIYLSVFTKITDPYTRFRLYNKNAIMCLKKCFNYKLYTYNFIMLLYLRKNHFIEVKTKQKKSKLINEIKRKIILRHFETFIYTIFITPFIKKFKINKCE